MKREISGAKYWILYGCYVSEASDLTHVQEAFRRKTRMVGLLNVRVRERDVYRCREIYRPARDAY